MLVLRDVRVVDGRGVRAERADVLLRDGRIAIISESRLPHDATAGAEILDLPGRTIVPGLMNAHAHICLDAGPDPEATLRAETQSETAVRGAARLLRVLQSGVTAIRDVGAPWGIDIALRRMVDRGDIPGPRMITAGRNITMTGGHGNWMGIEADGPDGVRHAARLQIKAGGTAIKVMATGGMMTPNQVAGAPQLTVDEMRAACEEAHKAGFPVAAHSESDAGTRNAVLAGVDSIEHGHGTTVETLELMLERGTTLTPTILSDRRIIEAPPDAGIPDFVVQKCIPLADSLIETVHNAFRMGVTITAGNDGGAPLVHIGEMADELELYVQHGFTPQQAIEAGTINTGRLFRLAEVGYLEPGWHADLLVVDGDPLANIGALRSPAIVFKAGERVGLTPSGRSHHAGGHVA